MFNLFKITESNIRINKESKIVFTFYSEENPSSLKICIAVLQVDGLVPLPVAVVPEVPVPPCVIWTVIRVRVVDEDSSFLLYIFCLQVIDHVESIIKETFIVEVNVVENILA